MNFKRSTLVITVALMVVLVLVVYQSGGNGGTLVCSDIHYYMSCDFLI